VTDSQEPLNDLTPEPESAPEADAAATSAKRRQRRMIAMGAIGAGVIALVVILIVTLGGSDKKISAQDNSTSSIATVATTATTVKKAAPTTTTEAATTTTEAATTTEAPTTTEAATTTSEAATTTSEAPTTTVAVTAPPVTAAPVTPVTAAAVGNCTPVGTLTIPATNTVQTIIKETTQYKDGLLCGNHKSDHIAEGVDILPGFASFETSVSGGPALVGQIPAVIFGHRNSHNRPFKLINTLQAGDAVTITNLDGSTIELKVDSVTLLPLAEATTQLLAPSVDGAPELHLVACAHADGTPGGVSHRWIATVSKL